MPLHLDPGGELHAGIDPRSQDLEDQVSEAVPAILDPGVAGTHLEPVVDPSLVPESLRRDND